MRKPSMKMAEWIAKQMESGTNPDDVYDTLTGAIQYPYDFVDEVKYYAIQYEAELERHNIKFKDFSVSP